MRYAGDERTSSSAVALPATGGGAAMEPQSRGKPGWNPKIRSGHSHVARTSDMPDRTGLLEPQQLRPAGGSSPHPPTSKGPHARPAAVQGVPSSGHRPTRPGPGSPDPRERA